MEELSREVYSGSRDVPGMNDIPDVLLSLAASLDFARSSRALTAGFVIVVVLILRFLE